MKLHQYIWPAFIAASLSVSATAQDLQDVTNRLTFSGRVGFNISARFKGISVPPPAASGRRTPNGDPYNYDNGYVLTDASGNFNDQTWYWGYDDSSKQISGNNILMSRDALSPGSGSVSTKDDPGYGAELVYRRLLWNNKNGLQLGLELAGNYLNLSLSDSSSISANVMRTTDPYPFTAGTVPPAASPGSPYQGSMEGPGFVIGATPGSSIITTVAGGAIIAGHRKLDANIWGFRFGPYLEAPVTSRLKLSLSAGVAGALVDADVSWGETITIASTGSQDSISGGGKKDEMLYGFYAAGTAIWEFNQRWSAVAGVQFQDLHDFSHSFGGRQVELDLSQSIFVTLGVSFNF